MANPEIAAKKPCVLKLDAGTYWWCACGKSKNQPFCDGSHAGTDFTPLEVKLDGSKPAALCACKHTKTPPFCDGSHSKL